MPEHPLHGDTEIDRAIADFLAHGKQRRRLSAATLKAYGADLRCLSTWAKTKGLASIDQLDAARLRAFAAGEHRRGLDARSIQRRLSAIRRWLDYLVRHGELKINPAADVQAPRGRRKLPRTLDTDQVALLLNLPVDGTLSARDRALMELAYGSGLRVSELAAMNWHQIDFDGGLVRVIGKGNKERAVPLGRFAAAALEHWRGIQGQDARPSAEAVFTSTAGRRLSVRAIQKRIAGWSKRQGLDQVVHPHQLRHSFASHILESSGDLRAVQELLGHANLSTTQIYTHLDFQHLAEVYDQTHPRARKGRK